MRQSSGRSFACASPVASAVVSVSFTGRAPFMPSASTCMYRSGSTSPGNRVISWPSGVNSTIVGYPLTLKRAPSFCAPLASPSM